MDRDRYPLATSREPNPLRPYYIPPSIGVNANLNGSATTSASTSAPPRGSPATASSKIGSSARDVFPELDLDLANTSSEAWQQTRRLLDTLVWRYTSVVLAQPFDVAKVILQVSLPGKTDPTPAARLSRKHATAKGRQDVDAGERKSQRRNESSYDQYDEANEIIYDSEESDDVQSYFTSAAPRSRSPRRRRRSSPSTPLSPSPTPTPRSRREHEGHLDSKLRLKRLDSISHVLSTLHTTSGIVGWWRASNCTFLYSILLRTTDSFIRSLLLAIVGLPEILSPEPAGLGPSLGVNGSLGFGGLDLAESPNPLGSLVVIGLSSCIAGLLLAPLDLVRTRLILTPTHLSPRGLVQSVRRLPSLIAPSSLWLPTALLHTIPQIFSASAPVLLRRQLKLGPETTPSAWSLAAFTTSLVDLFLRLPLETVTRRAQVTSLFAMDPDLDTIIQPARYGGVWGTMYNVMYVEGETEYQDSKGLLRTRRGQGLAGLIRGWRIGFWGLVGVWGAGAIGPGEARGRGRF